MRMNNEPIGFKSFIRSLPQCPRITTGYIIVRSLNVTQESP